MIIRILLVCVLAVSGAAHAGPFGLDMGMRLADVEKQAQLKSVAPYAYSTPSLPNGHPDFNDYRLLITPQHGLCKVSAWTPHMPTSVYGTQLKDAYDRLFKALTAKYGNGKKYDFLLAGSIWGESKDWMMALLRKERTLVTFWTAKEINLPDNIGSIKLEAEASNTDEGEISLAYEFKNSSDCIGWIAAHKNSNL